MNNKTMRGNWYIVKNDTTSWGGIKIEKNRILRVIESYQYFYVVEHENNTLLLYKQDLKPYLEIESIYSQ